MQDIQEKVKAFYVRHKRAVWIIGFGLFGILLIQWMGNALNELYAVDAVN